MKILVFGMSSLRGGVESFIHSYTSNFSEAVQIDYIAPLESIPYEEEFKKRGSKVFHIPSRRSNLKKHKELLNKIFEENNYDVVWSNLVTLSSVEFLEIAHKHNVPVRIVHSHNNQNMGNAISKIMHKLNSYKLGAIATDYWACSQDAAQWMFNGVKTQTTPMVVNNAIKVEDFIYNENTRKSIRDEFNINESTLLIGNVGRLHFQKNQMFLLEIFSEMHKTNSDTKLMIVGSGDLLEKLKNKARELNIQNSVIFTGQRDDIPQLMSAFDGFVLPSVFEGLGIVLVEAQAAGLPCFTSEGVVPQEANISPLLSYISLKKSAKEWAETILANIPVKRKDMTDTIVKREFEIKAEAKKIENILSDKANK